MTGDGEGARVGPEDEKRGRDVGEESEVCADEESEGNADESGANAGESEASTGERTRKADDQSWWTVEGETTGERVRDGLPQLAIICVLVWLGTTVTYNVLSATLDPITATASVVLGALYVGLRLRRWLSPRASNDGE